MDKKALRALIRQKKREMTAEQIAEKSERLCRMFLETEAYRQAKTVYGYFPYNQEVRTEPVLRQVLADGKGLAVPKIIDNKMYFICLQDLDRVAAGYAGIPEPLEDGPVAADKTALVLMPGIAFDKQGYRVGYGGGFYDKFLEEEPDHPTIALCYDFQMMDALQVEEYDIPVDTVFWA